MKTSAQVQRRKSLTTTESKLQSHTSTSAGRIPDFSENTALEYLALHDNDLEGDIGFLNRCTSLTKLSINNNPGLHGTITKALVLQCERGIKFSGCKGRVAANGSMNETFLAFPYLGGLTFSSQDIDNIMRFRANLGIGDAMITEPPAVEMDEEHGKKCLWQVTWAAPMFRLHDCKIFVKSSTPYDEHIKWDDTHPSFTYDSSDDDDEDPRRKDDWSSFMSKFLNFERYASHAENMRRDYFDAGCLLPEGERAHSILDWERRVFLLAAERNNLTIVHVKEGSTHELWGYDSKYGEPCIYTLNGKPTKPEWYCHYPEAEAEAIRRFKEEQEQAASPFPPSLSLSSFLSGLEEEQAAGA